MILNLRKTDMTRYEKKIYEIINSSYDHMTAEDVFAELKKAFPSVSLATVYNNLNKLCDTGLIRRISCGDSADRYDRTARHDHLVCRKCGKLADITFDDITQPLKSRLGEDFLYYDLKVYYICPECRKKG